MRGMPDGAVAAAVAGSRMLRVSIVSMSDTSDVGPGAQDVGGRIAPRKALADKSEDLVSGVKKH